MIIVADNLQITHPEIAKAVRDFNPEPIQRLVRRCIEAGADAIDINSGPLLKLPEKTMTFLVETVQEVTTIPILLDTVNPEAIETALKIGKNRMIINGFSLEPHKLETHLPLAQRYDAEIIGYLLHPNSHVPTDISERINIAIEMFEHFSQAGLPPEKLIVDPVVPPLTWENGIRRANDTLSLVRLLPEILGFPVKTIAGLSNLTTGGGFKAKKELMERTYLSMLAASGLHFSLMNVFHSESMQTANAVKRLRKQGIFSWEERF